MELITDGIAAVYPDLKQVLDIGCGAGNYPVKLAHQVSNFDCTLVDLSQPMLDKAYERVQGLTSGNVEIIKGDFRTAVLHHLRDDQDWEQAFEKLYRLLKKGGSLWIFDLVIQDHEAIQHLIYHQHYGAYLTNLKDESYRDHVFNYIEHEDTPRSLTYQLNLLKTVGFNFVDVLHKKLNFASFVAFK
ncbi:ubiquinone/menaquinone biosynthesis methyltransferase [compost metagenome]